MATLLCGSQQGCAPDTRRLEFVGQPPVGNVVVSTLRWMPFGTWTANEVELHLIDGVRLETVVDLQLFGAFRPGITTEEALRRFGQPSGFDSKPHAKYALYQSNGGQVAIGCENFDADWPCRWTLAALPTDALLEKVVDPGMARQILLTQEGMSKVPFQVQVIASNGHVAAMIDGDLVQRIVWVR